MYLGILESFFKIYLFMSALSVCTPACQKRASDPSVDGCEQQIWLLGVELRTSGRTTSALNF